MIKLKLDKLSDKFEDLSINMDQSRMVDFFYKKNGKIHIDVRDASYSCLLQIFYKKSEFWKAIKDFLVLRKKMERNND